MDATESMLKLLSRYGSSPYVMMVKDGFVARLGVGGSFLSFRSGSVAGALEGLLKMVSGREEEK